MKASCDHKIFRLVGCLTLWFIILFLFSLILGVTVSRLYIERVSHDGIYNLTYLGKEEFLGNTLKPLEAFSNITINCGGPVYVNGSLLHFHCRNMDYIMQLLTTEKDHLTSFIVVDIFIFLLLSMMVISMTLIVLSCQEHQENKNNYISLNI